MKYVQCRFCGADAPVLQSVQLMVKVVHTHARLNPPPKGHVGVDPRDIEADLIRQELEVTAEAC